MGAPSLMSTEQAQERSDVVAGISGSSTTVLTFPMVFVIQATQIRDSTALD